MKNSRRVSPQEERDVEEHSMQHNAPKLMMRMPQPVIMAACTRPCSYPLKSVLKGYVLACASLPFQQPSKPSKASAVKIQLHLSQGAKANAIPVEFADMRERLIADFPDYFDLSRASGGGIHRKVTFRRLADRIWLANRQRLSRLFQRWAETYRFFDPDVGSVVHPKSEISTSQFEQLEGKFNTVFYTVLDKAGFALIDSNIMKEAVENRVPGGLNLIPPPPGAIESEVFYRGEVQKVLEVRNMWTLFRRREVKYREYDRLLVMYRIMQDPDDFKEEEGCCGLKWPLLVKIKNMFSLGGESVTPMPHADPQLLYMKIFKDVRSLDIDMIMPGSALEFTWLDVAFIWIPTFIGLYSAIKAVIDIWGTQTGILDYATLVVLMLMPLSWGYKAYKETKNKENECAVQLSNIYMTQNLNNNKGVCGDILEEALEQETNEAMLAYFFLWQGGDNMGFMEKGVLDRTVEDYLKQIMVEYDQEPDIDFDVGDAVDKLVLMGICTRRVMPDGTTLYKAAELEESNELINPVRVAAYLNSLGTARGRGPCAMSDWHEEIQVYPTTGERARYFWNASTGAQQYEVPDTYVPLSLNATPGTVTQVEP